MIAGWSAAYGPGSGAFLLYGVSVAQFMGNGDDRGSV